MLSFRHTAALLALVTTHASAGTIAWPDPDVPVPDEVRTYIASECEEYRGWSEETVEDCVSGEIYGYRAVVTILRNEEMGERAAERYRGCAAGLGNIGGRFHRRKAECISKAYSIVWRFAYSRETSLQHMRKADRVLPTTSVERREVLEFAKSIIGSDRQPSQ